MNELLRRVLLLPEQASSIAREIDTLHYFVIGTAMLGLLLVVGAITFFALRQRKGSPEKARHSALPGWLEGAAIAGLLGLFLLFWTVGERQYLKLQTPPTHALNIYVVAKQWMWSFAYPDGIASNYELVVPVGQPVQLVISSRDVIHSFFVPAFRIKQDAIPGRATLAWFTAIEPGSYEILCAEYCGLSHSHMRGKVRVLRQDAYQRWREQHAPNGSAPTVARAERPEDETDLALAGERVASQHGCLRCHTLDGTPHLGPSWAGLYRSYIPLLDGRSVLADEAYLTRAMMDPAAEVRSGFEPMMPSYFGLLTPTETAALLELMRSLAQLAPAERSPLALPTERPPSLPVEEP